MLYVTVMSDPFTQNYAELQHLLKLHILGKKPLC